MLPQRMDSKHTLTATAVPAACRARGRCRSHLLFISLFSSGPPNYQTVIAPPVSRGSREGKGAGAVLVAAARTLGIRLGPGTEDFSL